MKLVLGGFFNGYAAQLIGGGSGKNGTINPIWLLYKNNKYVLLDGAHRIIASYIEGVEFIRAYIIYI